MGLLGFESDLGEWKRVQYKGKKKRKRQSVHATQWNVSKTKHARIRTKNR